MITKSASNNRRIIIDKKIEAVEYSIKVKSNVIASEKYGVSEWTIRNWKSNIDNLKKASKKKEKITLHKGSILSEETIETDIKLLDFVNINRKLGIQITTLSLKLGLLKICPDILNISSHWQYEYLYRFLNRNNLSIRKPGHVGQLLPLKVKEVITKYILDLRTIINEDGYSEYNIINKDETPLYLNMVPNKITSKKGETNVVVRTKIKRKLE